MAGIESGQDDIEPVGAIMAIQKKQVEEQKKATNALLKKQISKNNHGNSFASL